MEILTLLGKSGSGKSTLLKCIYGLEDLPKGEIIFGDEKVLGPSWNLIPGHADMKLVSQDYYVLDNHTVEENIADKLPGYTNEYKAKRIADILRVLDLKKIKDKRAKEISSGQKQRVSIARALADFPKLLLLDEPFSHLDFKLKDDVFTYIRENLIRENAACILVTHQADEALRYSNIIAVMEEGKIIQQDSAENIYHRPSSLKIARLFGKCYELDKKDFSTARGLKFTDSKTWLRPEDLSVAAKGKEKHLEVKVKNVLFALDKYEVIAETESGKMISFYSKNPSVEIGKTYFLSAET